MPSRRRQLRPRDYGRCTACGRLTEKTALVTGPDGGSFGPVCLEREIRRWADTERKKLNEE